MKPLSERVEEARQKLKAAYNHVEDGFNRLNDAVVDFADIADEVIEHVQDGLNGHEGEELAKMTDILERWQCLPHEEIDTELSYSSDQALGEVMELPKI